MTPLEEARGLLNAKDYPRALAAFDRLLLDQPDHALAHSERGRVLMGLERWGEAVSAFSEALKRDAARTEAWYNLGFSRGKRGEHAAAVADFNRYLEAHPGDADTHRQRGYRLLDLGEFAAALLDFEKAVSVDPAYEGETRVWIDLSRKLDRLRRDGPPAEFAAACVERGWAKVGIGDARSAVPWFSRAVEAVPADAEARRSRRAEARFSLGEKADAVADAAKAVELAPASGDAWRTYGVIRRKTGDLPGAIECLGKALELNPADIDAWFGRALARADGGDLSGAEADFGSAVERKPGESSTWLNRGWIRGKLGRHPEAEADYTRAIELDAKSAQAYTNRGYARQTLQNPAGMREDFAKALELNPALEAQLRPLMGAAPPAAPVVPVKAVPPAPPPPAPLPEPRPAEPADPEGVRLFLVAVGFAAVLLALGLLKVPYLGAAAARALDIPYKCALILGGAVEGGTVSWSSSNLCNEPFCARVDTELDVVWGRVGYSSQHKWAFCKDHKSSQWSTGSRLDGPLFVIPYWVLAYGAYLILGFTLIPLAIRLVAWPVLIPAVALKRRPWTVLLPWQERGKEKVDGLDALSFLVTAVGLAVTAIAYWWF